MLRCKIRRRLSILACFPTIILPCLFVCLFFKNQRISHCTLLPFTFLRYPLSAVCAPFMFHYLLLSRSVLPSSVCSSLVPFFLDLSHTFSGIFSLLYHGVRDHPSWHTVPLDTTHSKSTGVIGRLSVLSYAQNHSTTNILPSAQDENRQKLERCTFAVFKIQFVDTCSLYTVSPEDPCFGLLSLLHVVISISRHILLLFLASFCSFLSKLICDTYAIMKIAYVLHRPLHVILVLLYIGASSCLFHSNNFAVVFFKSAWETLCSLQHGPQTFSRKCRTACRSSGMSSCSFLMQRFQIGSILPNLYSCMLNFFPMPLSAMNASLDSSINGLIGGGSSRLPWMVIEPYAVSMPSTLESQSIVSYVDFFEKVSTSIEAYPKDRFVHADIPLKVASSLLSISVARRIAACHGVSAGSRCSVAQLSSSVEQHKCTNCPSYLIVFSVESNSTKKNAVRTTTYRERKTQLSSTDVSGNSDVFPPSPSSVQLEHAIIKNACKRMDPINFEEVGCAVCGELRQRAKTSRLKTVKNLLSILEVPGVSRVERTSNAIPVKEFKGPVLDYSCSVICEDCRAHIRQGKVPRLALARGLWLGKVPPVLGNLTFVEKLLVARVRHTCAFVKVASGMRKMKANIVAFESPIQKIYNILPPPREDLDEMLAILFTGPCKPTAEDFARTPFLVRRNAVINALEWLKLNHIDYADIDISRENVMQYEENLPPVTVEYRLSVSNKVPEGTSVFDNEDADGTVEGDCVFTVHGLTGDACNSMTPNALKAMALRHLNSGGKVLAVGHSDRLESMWNNTQLYPQMFPWLFPYGLGGIGSTSISHKEHKRHLLMYHDKRFQTDVNFPFVAFSHEQMMANTTQGFLLIEQKRFGEISNRLMNVDWVILDELTKRLEAGEHIQVDSQSDSEKQCFRLLQDLDAISGRMHGSTTSKKYMRNEIWSLTNYLGSPSWYITLSPADIQHPICVYFAGSKEKFSPDMRPSYDDRIRLVCQNPVAGARFFHFMVRTFLEDVLGINNKNQPGYYGPTSGYYGTVEQQGRLTLHLHMLLWIEGNLNPEDMRKRILDEDSVWRKKVIDWLERCHMGEFVNGTHADVSERIGELKKGTSYIDPTTMLPVPPPDPCPKHVDNLDDLCPSEGCIALSEWSKKFGDTVDDLLLRSNVHNCNKGTRKDGTRKKAEYAACMDNKWGKCKARFPRMTVLKSIIDETGAIIMKKLEPWINTFTPLVTYLLRCNTDVTSLSSGTTIKGVIMYVSDYIVKPTLKTHVIFDSIRTVFQKNGEMMGGNLPSKEKTRRFMTKVANLLSAKAEMGAPMIAMYLLGNPDHYTGHTFVPFYWQPYVQEARQSFEDADISAVPQKVTVIKKKGRILGLSPVHDYVHRPKELANINLYNWVRCYKRVKLPIEKKKVSNNEDEADSDSDSNNSHNISLSHEHILEVDSDSEYSDIPDKKKYGCSVMRFRSDHPLSDSHGIKYIVHNSTRIPNFIGANLPRCDQGDRAFYCSTMLVLFKPWRQGIDLKAVDKPWDEQFCSHPFTEEEKRYMRNFNIRYECLDARDNYRAQMMKNDDIISVNYDKTDGEEVVDDFLDVSPEIVAFDDVPANLLDSGPNHKRRTKEMETINQLMTSMGWVDPVPSVGESPQSYAPKKKIPGLAWQQEIERLKQKVQDKKNQYYLPANPVNDTQTSHTFHKLHTVDVVKIVDKSYLERDFHIVGASDLIEFTAKDFSLNKEQERAFRIIANHAICRNPEQLRMYLGGMGGTGKSQVIKALSQFFTGRNEAHRFITVAPTGSAAALLGGSTYHSMFGINERNVRKVGHIKAKLEGTEYVFLDEVSMLSARDMYHINVQLARVFEIAEIPFGGLNMVFSGDFAQLPPAVGGEHVSLYSRSIGGLSTDVKSQEEAVGKALWHQITTVVILRENMRQKKQSVEDAKLRVALENMRYKACKSEDIAFLRTRISSKIPGRPSICQDQFRNVSIITGTNLHKDEINRLGAIRFAQETGQTLTDFFSDDSSRSQGDSEQSRGIRVKQVREITDEMKEALWSQPPSSTDKHIAGKLSICIGLPVMIRYNYATEICMTRGQEGFVYGWQSKQGSNGWIMLDTLFVELKEPPTPVDVPGLPKNVVPVYPTTTNIIAMLPTDDKIHISRTQVEVLINFAMTDFASQGKTRPQNPSDLNNLKSHQSYYTALSRSATAEGTLILQGFDPRVITGGCSGALRQEFRELELLDEITRLRYSGKLPVTIAGDTRNNIIGAFREWRGAQYIPRNVHESIRWTKRNPWLESEALNLDERLEILEKQRQKKKKLEKKGNNNLKAPADKALAEAITSSSTVTKPYGMLGDSLNVPQVGSNSIHRSSKRRRSSGVQVQRRVSSRYIRPATKRKIGRPSLNSSESLLINNAEHYEIPIGCRWSQNSCAYDSVFTPMFALWCDNRDSWAQDIRGMGNRLADLLLEGFSLYERGETSLEDVRDDARRLIACSPNGTAFGFYTSIENVFTHLLRTNTVISESYYVCPNGHHVHHSDDQHAFLSAGVHNYESIVQWLSADTHHACTRCQICRLAVDMKLRFRQCPPLFAFCFPQLRIGIDNTFKISFENTDHTYRLAAVIYYANQHFTVQIITRDGRIWFYDGMEITDPNIQPCLEYVGSIYSQPNLNRCRGGDACAAIYSRTQN